MANINTLAALGYVLKRNVTDGMGVKHKFGLYPIGAGGINYFDSIEELSRFEVEVQIKRKFESETELKND